MKRGLTFLTLTVALVLAFALTAGAAEFTLKFANPVPKDHSWGRAGEYFAEQVKEATGGRVEVQVHHSGALGKIREVLEMAKAGTVDFVLSGTGHVTGYVPEVGLTVLPYLWKDTSTMFEAPGRPLWRLPERTDEQARLGSRGLVGQWFPPCKQQSRPHHEP